MEPTSNGIGSDAFAIVWDGRALHGLNGSGRTGISLQNRGSGFTLGRAIPTRWVAASGGSTRSSRAS